MQTRVVRERLKQKRTWIALLGGLGLALYAVFLYLPTRARLSETAEKLAGVRQTIREVYASVPDPRNMSEGLLQMQNELDRLRELLPASEDVSGLVRLFSAEAQKRKIKIVSITPQSPVPFNSNESAPFGRWSCFSVPLEVRLQGRYREVAEFIAGLSATPRLTTLRRISLRRDKSIEPFVRVECEFLTYYLLEETDHDTQT